MIPREFESNESKEVLRERSIYFLKGMLAQDVDELNTLYIDDYNRGVALRPADKELAKKTEKEEIHVTESKSFTIEDILNEILNNGEYSDYFLEMIAGPIPTAENIKE